VQIARSLGAYVIGTASAPKHDILRDLGADELIDYREQDFEQIVDGVDVVIDAIGGDYTGRSPRTLRPAASWCRWRSTRPSPCRRRPRASEYATS